MAHFIMATIAVASETIHLYKTCYDTASGVTEQWHEPSLIRGAVKQPAKQSKQKRKEKNYELPNEMVTT